MKRKLLAASAIVAAIALFFLLDLDSLLTLESLKRNRGLLVGLYHEHPVGAASAFIAVYIIVTALSLPGAAVLSLAAGAVFGVVAGTAYAVAAATAGATAAFLLARYLFHDTVQERFGDRIARLNDELDRKGLPYLLFLRLVPLFPFFLVNIAAALTRLPLRTYLLGTFLGIIPGGIIYVNAGASLASIESAGQVVSPRVLVSLVLLGLLALVPVVWSKMKGRG